MITYKNRSKVSSKNKGDRAYHYHGNIHVIYTDKKPTDKTLYEIAQAKYPEIKEVVKIEIISVEVI